MGIETVTRFKTDDGKLHDTLQEAKRYEMRGELLELFGRIISRYCESDDIVGAIEKNAGQIREYLDAVDAVTS